MLLHMIGSIISIYCTPSAEKYYNLMLSMHVAALVQNDHQVFIGHFKLTPTTTFD
jgi:hypothetical protein